MNNNALETFARSNRSTIITAILFVALGGASGLWWLVDHWAYEVRKGEIVPLSTNGVAPPVPELQLYKPLLPEQAKMENDKLPFSNAPLERALPLVLPASELLAIGKRNATDCLTSAIYYEAANEIGQGQRAVAQVILNRVRHPAYPKTICGVVYQGSERKTGCQFTFTCDGSLARRPARGRWEQARLTAIGAISGAVEPSVGMATHYHANYVLPYWASSLDKVSQIGTHIFYRWKGSWGRRQAFSQMVQLDDGVLPAPIIAPLHPGPGDQLQIEQAPATITSRLIADELSPAESLLTPSLQITSQALSPIQADQARSILAADEKVLLLKSN